MIKLFSLNHTRIRRFSILAQDKTQFRRVTVLIFRVRNTSASAHTNYLVHLLKSVELLLNRGCVFYMLPRCCQPLFEEFFEATQAPNNQILQDQSGQLSEEAAVADPSEVVRILQRICTLSTANLKKLKTRFLQTFQAVNSLSTPPETGVCLERDAHSTDPSFPVNDLLEKNAGIAGTTYKTS